MNKNITNTLLSLSAILALSGCGTNGDYTASNNETKDEPKGEIGLKGKVLSSEYIKNAKVCFDINSNGLCDANEKTEITNEEGVFTFEKDVYENNKNALLLASIKDSNDLEYVLSANVDSISEQVISPFTTLVVNEQFYNPFVEGDKTKAIDYLLKNIPGLNKDVLEGKEYLTDDTLLNNAKSLGKSFSTAYALNKIKVYEGIGNVVDEVVKNGNYEVDIKNFKEQVLLGEGNFLLKDLNLKTTWEKKYKDEIALGSTSTDSKVISYSKWHNKLTVLDTSDKTKKANELENKYYLDVSGGRDVVDATTGASEQEYKKAIISSDNKTLYSIMSKYSDKSSAKGVGIYFSNIESTLPTLKFASLAVGSTNYYNYAEVSDFDLSSDNSKLVVSGDDKKIKIFNAKDLSSESLVFDTTSKVKTIAFSERNDYIFASLSARKNHTLAIYSSNDGTLLGEFRDDSIFSKDTTTYINDILYRNDNEIFISLNESKKVLHLDISNKSDIKIKQTLEASSFIKNMELSKDKKYIILSLTSKQVNLIDIDNMEKNAKVILSSDVNNAFELEENKIAITNGSSIEYFELVDGLSQEDKNNWLNTHRK